jgi:hypothetical protein
MTCDDCAVCGHWPEADRWALREMLDSIPLSDDVCDDCNVAFFRNLFPDLFPAEPTKH